MTWTAAMLERKLSRMTTRERRATLRDIDALPPVLWDDSFPQQKAFIHDRSKFLVLLCSRRAGKTFGAGGYRLIKKAMEIPGCSVLFVGLTHKSAKKNIWADVLKRINAEHGLGAKFHESDLTMTLTNESTLYVMGADHPKTKERIRGGKYAEICIDEADQFGPALQPFLNSVIIPAVMDYDGVVTLCSTPGNFQVGLYFELTQGQDPMMPGQWTIEHQETAATWHGHRWHTTHNPHMRLEFEKRVAKMRAVNPLVELTPSFQQEMLGKWAIDTSALIYCYDSARDDFDGVLPRRGGHWTHVLGVDLGYNDDTALTVAAYNSTDPVLYFLESWKRPGMDVNDVVECIEVLEGKRRPEGCRALQGHRFAGQYAVNRKIVDGSAKQAVETMRQRYHQAFTNAEKTEKWEHMMLMRGDFLSQRIKVGPHCGPLKHEWAKLIRDPDSIIPRELPSVPNHAADSAYYIHRNSYNYLSKIPKRVPQIGDPDWQQWDRDQRILARQAELRRGLA